MLKSIAQQTDANHIVNNGVTQCKGIGNKTLPREMCKGALYCIHCTVIFRELKPPH